MSSVVELTDAQDHVLRHALGLDWSERPYRNGFKAPLGHAERGVCEVLVDVGLMGLAHDCFFVTDRGFQVIFGRDWKAMKARAEA